MNKDILEKFVNTVRGKDGTGSNLLNISMGPHLSDALVSSPIIQVSFHLFRLISIAMAQVVERLVADANAASSNIIVAYPAWKFWNQTSFLSIIQTLISLIGLLKLT